MCVHSNVCIHACMHSEIFLQMCMCALLQSNNYHIICVCAFVCVSVCAGIRATCVRVCAFQGVALIMSGCSVIWTVLMCG